MKESAMTGKWAIKYYKVWVLALAKIQGIFQRKRFVHFHHTDKCEDCIDLVFNKKRADDRKEWLGTYNRKLFLTPRTPHFIRRFHQ